MRLKARFKSTSTPRPISGARRGVARAKRRARILAGGFALGVMRALFEVAPHEVGAGPTTFAWSPDGQYLAVSGIKLRVLVLDRSGAPHDEIALDGREHLNTPAVMQFASHLLFFVPLTGGTSPKHVDEVEALVAAGRRRQWAWTGCRRRSKT